MKADQRRLHSARHTNAVNRMMSPFVTRLKNILIEQVKNVASDVRSSGVHHAATHLHKSVINESLHSAIEDMYKLFGVYMARKTTAQINKSARIEQKAFGIDQDLIDAIIAYLKANIFMKAVIPISQTNRDMILARIMEGQQKGLGAEEIASGLEQWDMPAWRALMLVRTESLFAMQYGAQAAKTNSRWETQSEWIAANDHRTRHSHKEVDGETVPEGGRFKVSIYKKGVQSGFDMMKGPGDPTASAQNVCNCRCTMVTVARRDENGRLILKNKTNSNILLALQ